MTSRTTTRVTHYHVRKKRRAEFIEEWRRHQKTAVHMEDVRMELTAPGVHRGVYVGADGETRAASPRRPAPTCWHTRPGSRTEW